MIAFNRAQARLLRAILRKCVPLGSPRHFRPLLVFQGDQDGLRIRFDFGDVAGQWHLPGPPSTETIAISGKALDDFEGSNAAEVTLTMPTKAHVQARWAGSNGPQTREYAAIDTNTAAFPAEPRQIHSMDASLLRALADAAQASTHDGGARAMSRTQLRGKTGEIASTNNRQLLLQRGFAFPWQEDILIPTIGVFGCKELPGVESIGVGRTDTHICLFVGPWQFFLRIDPAGRFPRIDNAIPSQFTKGANFHLTDEDAEFLLQELPRLPGNESEFHDVTVELRGSVVVRGRDQDKSPATELLLNRSRSMGPAMVLVSDRKYLIRAMRFGFTEFFIPRADGAIVARDRHRLFVWMALNPENAIAASAVETRIESTANAQPVAPPIPVESSANTQSPSPARRTKSMSASSSNGHPPNNDRTERGQSIVDLIAEAEELRNILVDASSRLGHLLSGLKQHRRQSRAVQAAMHSLQQLRLEP